jgi:hypothetical protein
MQRRYDSLAFANSNRAAHMTVTAFVQVLFPLSSIQLQKLVSREHCHLFSMMPYFAA